MLKTPIAVYSLRFILGLGDLLLLSECWFISKNELSSPHNESLRQTWILSLSFRFFWVFLAPLIRVLKVFRMSPLVVGLFTLQGPAFARSLAPLQGFLRVQRELLSQRP